ncbi:hypothetical protein DD237_008251 [Peronospora effusa]|uniref:Uncharacterized protein n=1 Tax=Peronospora effusa TaxID=542832 RepID=A0A425C3A3_9STRA|nr:hypothetical protein DD237_008251 [Peronospora effusa]
MTKKLDEQVGMKQLEKGAGGAGTLGEDLDVGGRGLDVYIPVEPAKLGRGLDVGFPVTPPGREEDWTSVSQWAPPFWEDDWTLVSQ